MQIFSSKNHLNIFCSFLNLWLLLCVCVCVCVYVYIYIYIYIYTHTHCVYVYIFFKTVSSHKFFERHHQKFGYNGYWHMYLHNTMKLVVWKSTTTNPSSQIMSQVAQFNFAKMFLDKDNCFWEQVLSSHETKIQLFRHNDVQKI